MQQNIKNNNSKRINARLNFDNYYDFMIYRGEIKPINEKLENIAYFDFSKNYIVGDKIYSEVTWKDAINEGITLYNIGFTGVDNGFITYRKDQISNEDFLNIYTKSKYEIPKGDMRFFITPVSGNTLDYTYEMVKEEDYIKLNGGFFQGFFKVPGGKYQTLPTEIEDKWVFNIKLRKRNDYGVSQNSLNDYNEDNSGIFFYIGTRAENKFWPYYKKDEERMKEFYDGMELKDDYFKDYDVNHNEVLEQPYFNGLSGYKEDNDYNLVYEYEANNDYFLDNEYNSIKKENKKIDEYFKDGYGGVNAEECLLDTQDDYFKEDTDLSEIELKTNEGYDVNLRKISRFTTDNKFMFFNNTPTGFTTNSWNPEDSVEFVRFKDYDNLNLYPYVNNTPTGYTTDNVDEIIKTNENAYNILNDLIENAIGFKINNDGSVSYRYILRDCENNDKVNKYKIEEESTVPGLINDNEWEDIQIIFFKTVDKMKILIKVNGLLKLVSKELPLLNLRMLKDLCEKQEGVPFNISIGGGSQGLTEAIYLDYYNKLDYILPIEKYFGGSFIGDIKNFSFSL